MIVRRTALALFAALLALPASAQFAAKATPAPAATSGGSAAAASDFEAVVGRLGFGWTGISSVPIAKADGSRGAIDVPVLGIRWWTGNGFLGLDAGVGVGAYGGKQGDAKQPSGFGLLLHGGLPLVLAQHRHLVLELTPEVNLGFASGSATVTSGSTTGTADLVGFELDVGARAGAEVFFGFMGLPQLSLEAGVGLFVRTTSWGMGPPQGSAVRGSQTTFGTERYNAPWDFFTGTVAARYYF